MGDTAVIESSDDRLLCPLRGMGPDNLCAYEKCSWWVPGVGCAVSVYAGQARKRIPVGSCGCGTCRCGRCELHRLCPHSPLYAEQVRIEHEIHIRTGTWVDLSDYTPPKVPR